VSVGVEVGQGEVLARLGGLGRGVRGPDWTVRTASSIWRKNNMRD